MPENSQDKQAKDDREPQFPADKSPEEKNKTELSEETTLLLADYVRSFRVRPTPPYIYLGKNNGKHT